MIDFSVIVPVYNVEKYIGKCIESILSQNYDSYELLLIDDGSTDASGRICDEYAEKSNKIHVIHQKNQGVSKARNAGLESAAGQYILFVDSDDYVESTLMTEVAEILKKNPTAEQVIFNAVVENEDGTVQEKIVNDFPEETIMSIEENRNLFFAAPALWTRVFVKDKILEHHIIFEPGIAIAEDLLFDMQYASLDPKVVYTNKFLYHYIRRGNSVTLKKNLEPNKSVFQAFDKIIQFYKNRNLYVKYKNELEYLAVFHLYITMAVRIIKIDYNSSLLKEIEDWMQKNFAGYRKNLYLKNLSLAKRIVLTLLKLKQYRIIKILFHYKDR